ncbi:hypothetical protein SAMN04488054_102207 [Salibacterium qingdaonense]|uniref:Uncharacterized protein n=1 Tax=Salibacterium qingdaonense TaxID=266892 RepID=A0A1I4IS77_9BACI|nr:hypothetical protein SAMN04488054_102207 [Salibacterium qingdaonense]
MIQLHLSLLRQTAAPTCFAFTPEHKGDIGSLGLTVSSLPRTAQKGKDRLRPACPVRAPTWSSGENRYLRGLKIRAVFTKVAAC